MPESIRQMFSLESTWSMEVVLVRLIAALVFGLCVAVIYRATHGRGASAIQSLMATLVMLSVLIALVTLVIGENQARAFSLVGALAIIRFRTVVEDTRDTAFVIFAVAVGMGAGAGYLGLTLMGMPIAAVAAFLFRPPIATGNPRPGRPHLLTVRVTLGRNPEQLVAGVLEEFGSQWKLSSACTARQGAALEATWEVDLPASDAAIHLVEALNKIDGVHSVEIRPVEKASVAFS